MLIEIEKIRRVAVKDEMTGKRLPDPNGTGFLMEERVANEAIDVNSIKSIRPFRDDGKAHRGIDGPVAVIYLYNNHPNDDDSEEGNERRGRRTSEVHVAGDYKVLLEKINELKEKSV